MEKLSYFTYLFCIFFIAVTSFFYYPKWNKTGTEATISWDASGYYWYLPAFFIYEEPKKVPFSAEVIKKYQPSPAFDQAFLHQKSQNFVMKYPLGLALQLSPFFAVANTLAKPFGFEPDGFSKPYQLANQLGGVLMAFLGLWFLRKVLLLYFEDRVVALVLLLFALCTNYLNYSAIDTAMTHNWLFSWYAILIYQSHHFYQKATMKRAVGIGAIVGLMAITRPTEIISIIIPLLWGLHSLKFDDILAHFLFIKNHFSKYIAAVLAMIAVGSIQLFYWKYVTGEWFVYSYQDQGFSWLHPHFKDYLFSYRSGWLLYTPLMIFAYLGIFPLLKNAGKSLSLRLEKVPYIAVVLFILVNTYIVCAWDIWWFGGRAMVQSYPILAFPLATFIAWIGKYKIKYLFYVILGFCFYYNIWWTHGSHRGGMFDPFNMTRGFLYHSLGDWDEKPEKRILFDTNEWFGKSPQQITPLFASNIENDTSLIIRNDKRVDFASTKKEFSRLYSFGFKGNGSKWIRVSATLEQDAKEWDVWKMPHFVVIFKNVDEKVKENVIRPTRLMEQSNQTQVVDFDVKIPTKTFDKVEVYFWNPNSDKTLFIHKINVVSHD